MAKKAASANTEKKTKRSREKKTVEKKDNVGYSRFICTAQKDIILKHIDRIEEICRTYQGIDECPLDIWKELDSIVVEVGKAYFDDDNSKDGFCTYMRIKPKKRATYTITHRVREMEHKKFILGFCERIKNADEEYTIHYTHLIFSHLAIWLDENGKDDK